MLICMQVFKIRIKYENQEFKCYVRWNWCLLYFNFCGVMRKTTMILRANLVEMGTSCNSPPIVIRCQQGMISEILVADINYFHDFIILQKLFINGLTTQQGIFAPRFLYHIIDYVYLCTNLKKLQSKSNLLTQ